MALVQRLYDILITDIIYIYIYIVDGSQNISGLGTYMAISILVY